MPCAAAAHGPPRPGVPTAATYVFVNMLRKLRDDFSPEYLAAVF